MPVSKLALLDASNSDVVAICRAFLDQTLQLLAQNQKDAGEVSTPHFVVPNYQGNNVH